jgi:hypothetical protein
VLSTVDAQLALALLAAGRLTGECSATSVTNSSEVYELPEDRNARKDHRRIGGPEVEALFNPGTTELDGTKCAPIGNRIDRLIWHEARA